MKSTPQGGGWSHRARSAAAAGSERVLLFRVGGRSYGCAMDTVREVVPFRVPARLPGAPPHVLGLVNLRGALVTVIDLAVRLEPSTPPRTVGSVIIVEEGGAVAQGGRTVGIAVDSMRDVQTITPEPLPEGDARGAADGLVRCLGHLGDDVIVILDMERLVRQSLQPRGEL